MAELSRGSKYPASAPAVDQDDEFERNLKEMLKDGLDQPIPANSYGSNSVRSSYDNSGGYGARALDLGTGAPRGPPPPAGVPRSYTSPAVSAAATTEIPLSSPTQRSAFSSPTSGRSPTQPNAPNGQDMAAKLETIKEWSINTFKCTKQFITEKLGKSSRTVDVELEAQIERLRETQRKYAHVLRLSRALASHFQNVVQTQKQLGDAFSELAQKSPELMDEFSYNSESQRALARNGETLLAALNFFTSSVNTLVNKTIEDTILTIKNYEAARLEFDAYKHDFDMIQLAPKENSSMAKLHEAQRKFEQHKEKYEKLRADVSIKLKFLEENKVKVMHKQLYLFHNAISAYFSGNQAALEGTLKQFSVKLTAPNTQKKSWLEQ